MSDVLQPLPLLWLLLLRMVLVVVLAVVAVLGMVQELTYNYQADTLGGFVERQKCLCGEPQCSGFIGGEVWSAVFLRTVTYKY